MEKMTPFAMDRDKKGLIVFRVERGEDLGLYVWVFLRKDVRFFPVSEFARYSKITGEAMDVSSKFDEEIVREAVETIRKLPAEETDKLIKEYNRLVENIGGAKAWKEREKKMLELAETAKRKKQPVYWY